MSRKTRFTYRPRSKRGQAPLIVDFLSPLSVEECLARLEAGRSPVHSYDLDVTHEADGTVRLDFVERTPRRQVISPGSRSTPARVGLGTAWAESVWFEGRVEPTGDGLTHVRGEIRRSFGASWVFTLMVAVPALLALVGAAVAASQSQRLWAVLLFGVWTILTLAWGVTGARLLRARRLAQALARWIDQRLNVERSV